MPEQNAGFVRRLQRSCAVEDFLLFIFSSSYCTLVVSVALLLLVML